MLRSSLNNQRMLLTSCSKLIQQVKLVLLCHGILLELNAHILIVKKNINEVIAVLDPNNTRLRRLIAQTPVLRHFTKKCISDDIAVKNAKWLKKFSCINVSSWRINRNTREPTTGSVYFFYISFDVTVKGVLGLVAFKETTRGVDIKDARDKNLTNPDVPFTE